MPLVKCVKDGKHGWSWGTNNNTCFTGKDGKLRAIKQGIAIEGPNKFRDIMKTDGYVEHETESLITSSASIQD